MNLYIIFAQRKCSYPGEYAPEALHVVDEFSRDENPDWIAEKLAEAQAADEFVSADIICIRLDDKAFKAIKDRLYGLTVVEGKVAGEGV
jgi:hypothetical protein